MLLEASKSVLRRHTGERVEGKHDEVDELGKQEIGLELSTGNDHVFPDLVCNGD